MKNKIIIWIVICVSIVVLGSVMIMLFNSLKPPDVGTFNLVDYQGQIETFPFDRNVGEIDDARTAIKKAKELWTEKYNKINSKPYISINGMKIEVSYDSQHDCWLINGTLPKNMLGGVPYVLIQRDGKVLAVWYDD